MNLSWRDIDPPVRYSRDKYDDIVAAITTYKPDRTYTKNGKMVDLDNMLVWNHKDSEPIAKVTGCSMNLSPGREAYLQIDAVTLSEETKEKIMKKFDYNKSGGGYRTEIKRVIFSDPATIVFWADGTKTVVKAHNEDFDPEKGLAMAVCKRLYGDKYHRIFKDFLPKEEPVEDKSFLEKAIEDIRDLSRTLNAGKENK